MTRQPDFRREPTSARLATSGLVALPAPAESRPPRSLASRDRPRTADSPAATPPRMFPGISIQAFCDTDSTAAALETAAASRHLAKAQMEVSGGGIDAAMSECTGPEARGPSVLVVETTLARPQMLAKLGRLADRCDSATRIVAIGPINDITLYRELMKRGIAEYLVAPVSPAQFVDVVAALCSSPAGDHAGRLIAFIGAKGGTGSSTVCHNVAWALSETLKCEVVVADLDLAFGTAGLDFNHETLQGVAEALQAPERLDETALDRLLTRCSQHLSVLAAPVALDRDYDISAGACRTVLDALRQHAPFAALDLPHAWTPWLRQVLLAADEVVLTVAPDLANLRNARNIVDLLEVHHGRPPRLVINMMKRRKRPDLTVEELSSALDLEPVQVIELDAETFGAAANNGQMIEEYSRKARAAQQFRALALALAQRAEPQKAYTPSPLAPILDKLGLRG
jgi:pilus assembly protein CpaE